MNQEGLNGLEKKAVLDGTKEILKIAGVHNFIDIKDFGVWRNSSEEFGSIDWYLQQARKTSRNKTQLNATTLITALEIEPMRDVQDHYDIMIIHLDMYPVDEDYEYVNFVIGIASKNIGTVISTNRFRELEDDLMYDCIKTETMHELGHVFALPNKQRNDLDYSLGPHCANTCIMRQGINLPYDWIKFSRDRLKSDPLCSPCKKDLKNYFK